MPTPPNFSCSSLLRIAALSLLCTPVRGAPYTPGDLIMGFVAGGGKGASQSLVLNLGTAHGFRDGFDAGTDRINFKTIGPQLAAQFSTMDLPWYERTDLFFSVVGARSATASTTVVTNGDPNRTVYVSQGRLASTTPGVADSSGWSVATDGNMTTASGRILATSQRYGDVTSIADAQGVAIIADEGVEGGNTYDEFTRPTTATSFGAFNGGIEQTFTEGSWGTLSPTGAVEAALDYYRVSPKNNIVGQYGYMADNSGIREGLFKGTFTINQSGQISFIASRAAAADGFDTWATSKGLPGLTTTDDRDLDNIPALVEYALDLNPNAFDTLPFPTSTAGGLQFSYTKGAAAAVDPKISFAVEASSTLASAWTALPTTANSSTQITAILPANDPSGRNFGRLKITKTN